MRKYLQLEEVGDGIGRIHMLKKIVKEADNIVTDLHNIDASWVVSGILALARIPNIDWVRISANFPRTIAELLSDHNLANHPLGIIPVMDWAHISGLFPRTIAQLLSDHNLANHPLVIIPSMDWAHISGLFPRTIADLLSNHNLANHPLAIIPTMDDGHIPNLETLSYGGAFAVAQIPGLPASQITSGQFPLGRMPRAASGLFLEGNGATDPIYNALIAANIPNLDAAKITTGTFPVARGGTGLSTIALGGILYASALNVLSRLAPTAANQVLRSTAANALQFAVLLAADIPNLDADKITSGAFALARIPNMDWAHISGLFPRTIADLLSDHNLANHPLAIIPVMDDGHIPNLETLSYGGAFAVAQIPALPASQITSGQFPLSRMPRAASGLFLEGNGATDPIYNALVAANIPNLDTAKITTGTFPVARGGTGLSTIALGGILYASALNILSRLAPTAANQVLRSTAANALQFAALVAADIPNLDASKITSGAFALARIPNMDWAHISGLFPRTIADLLSNHDLARHVLGTIVPHDALASLTEKAHGSLTGVTSDQHHPQAHTLASHSTKAHTELTGVTSDQHHPQAHTLASHTTKAHTELTGVTSDQHHAKYTDGEVTAIIAAKLKAGSVTDTTDAAGLISVAFAEAFASVPVVIVQLEGDVDYYSVITAKDVNGFTVKILKTAHLHAQGNTGAEAAHTHGVSFTSGAGSSHRHTNPSTSYVSAGTPAGTVGAEAAHTHGISLTSGAGSSHRHSNPNTSAVSAGTPSGSISSVSAGTPSGTVGAEATHTHGISFASGAGSAHHHTNPNTSAVSAGTPSGSISSVSAGTPSGTIGAEPTPRHTHGISFASGAGSAHKHTQGITGTPSATTSIDAVGARSWGKYAANESGGSPTFSFAAMTSVNPITMPASTHTHTNPDTANESLHTHSVSGTSGVASSHSHSFAGDALATHNHTFTGSALGTHSHTIADTGNESTHTHGVSGTSGAGSSHTHSFTGSALATHNHTFTGSALATHYHTQGNTGYESSHTHTVSGTSGSGSSHNHSFTGSALGTHRHTQSSTGYESAHTHSVSGTSGAGSSHSHTNPNTAEVNAGNLLATTEVTFSYIAMIP